jgi:hypothetical protein
VRSRKRAGNSVNPLFAIAPARGRLIKFPKLLGSLIRLRGPLGARASSARPVQCRDDRLAFGADNVCRVVIILIVRFHHVEDHRLRLIAGGAPNSGKSG